MQAAAPIGVYDSGLGGLTVVRRLQQLLPGERLIYVGDTARVPYGEKSAAEIIHFSRQIIRFLLAREVKMVVVACNTSSALALPIIKREYGLPILGMIRPAVQEAVEVSTGGIVGLMATEATVESGSYAELLSLIAPRARLLAQPCPQLVPLIESGRVDSPEARAAVYRYTAPFRRAGVDTVILGCTHYPFLREEIGQALGPGVAIVDPATSVAGAARDLLVGRSAYQKTKNGPDEYFVSGDPTIFMHNARVLGWELTAKQIDLSRF